MAIVILFACLFVLGIQKPQASIPESTGRVIEIQETYIIIQTSKSKAIVYTESLFSYGDVLALTGEWKLIRTNQNFYGFDYERYVHAQGINYAMHPKSITLVQPGSKAKNILLEYLRSQTSPFKEVGLQLLIYEKFGKEELDYLRLSFNMALLSLRNGLFALITLLLPNPIAHLIITTMFGVLCLLLGFRYLCFRIALHGALRLVLPQTGEKQRFGILLIVSLLCFPSIGYSLSFLVPSLFRLALLFDPYQHFRWVRALLLAYLQTFFFQTLSLISLFLYPVLVRLGGLIYGVFLLSTILVELQPVALWLYECSIQLLKMLESLSPQLWIAMPLLCFWFGLSAIFYYLQANKTKVLLSSVAMVLLCYSIPKLRLFPRVIMFDVGQGDMILVDYGRRRGVMLIDAAGDTSGRNISDILMPSLQAYGIKTIERLVLSHADFDHSGNADLLADLVPIKQTITTKQELLSLPNMTPFLSDIDFFDENDNSLLFATKVGSLCVFFGGDAGKVVEERLLATYEPYSCDILKVSHHGSKTSTSLSLLEFLRPRIGLISVGYENHYGHPHIEVLEQLALYDVLVKQTALDGAIQLIDFGFFQILITARKEFVIIG
ncbi:MAG: ComEC/Rec2 family competence protein [Erysipelotrichaceae bacterium]